jgi:hypothetical protein
LSACLDRCQESLEACATPCATRSTQDRTPRNHFSSPRSRLRPLPQQHHNPPMPAGKRRREEAQVQRPLPRQWCDTPPHSRAPEPLRVPTRGKPCHFRPTASRTAQSSWPRPASPSPWMGRHGWSPRRWEECVRLAAGITACRSPGTGRGGVKFSDGRRRVVI